MAEVMINTRFSGVEMPIQQPSSPGSVALCPGLQDSRSRTLGSPLPRPDMDASKEPQPAAVCVLDSHFVWEIEIRCLVSLRRNEHKLLGQRAGQRPMNQTF